MRVAFHTATPERWADVEMLFGPRGACGGCWCMWPFLRGEEYARGKGEPNRTAFRRRIARGDEPGILAYVDGAPAAWCAVAPRARYPRIAASRLFADTGADDATWAVVCFFVAKPYRGQGFTVRLLEEAARHARRHGASAVEGYPVDTDGRRSADTFVFTGHASAFRDAGYDEVARPSPTRPVMRRVLKPAAFRASAAGRARGARKPSPRTRARRAGARARG